MKRKAFVFTIGCIVFFGSCSDFPKSVDVALLDNGRIDLDYLSIIGEEEKILISWYLFAYGNECAGMSTDPKCRILKTMGVDDECNPKHISKLLQWFSKDMLAVYKLQKCPLLPKDGAIQNKIEKITIGHHGDTLTMTIQVKGFNSVQEKYWDILLTDQYIIRGGSFTKILDR